jgi:hypothetical protein
MQRAFPYKEAVAEKKKTPGAAAASIIVCRPQSEVDYIIYVLTHWQVGINIYQLDPGSDERDWLMRFCRQHYNGTKLAGKYSLEWIQVPGENPCVVLGRQEKGTDGKLFPGQILVYREQSLMLLMSGIETIQAWFRKGPGHIVNKSISMSPRHSSSSTAQCALFAVRRIQLVICRRAAEKPIRLLTWQERFELNLIDFCQLRKRDPFVVLMSWILTLKDHATALVYLCALSRKKANLIAYNLQEIFGIISYPKIFLTDDGKEFTPKIVLQFLLDLNLNILMATGSPGCPTDQGSVENMNKFVKRTLGTVLAEYRLVGKHPNWIEILRSIASAINTQHGQGKDDVSAYEVVYGQKKNHEFSCSKEKVRQCWTVSDQLKIANDPKFNEYTHENYILNDAEIVDDDVGCFFCDRLLPSNEKDKVSG